MTTGQCPHSSAQTSNGQRKNSDAIPCPALLAFYQNGRLNPDDNGNLSADELDQVLASVGLGASVRRALIKGADKSDAKGNPQARRDGKFNLFKLRDSPLDHTGSTGVRDPKVQPELLESNLLRFGKDGRMYAEHFAAAANHCHKEETGMKGTILQTVEFTAILEVFGRIDESSGKRYLTSDDVTGLWLYGKYPDGWKPRPAEDMGAGTVALGVTDIVLKRLLKAIGL